MKVDNEIIEYLEDCKDKLKQFDLDRTNLPSINNFPLMQGQALYVVDYVDQVISYQKGVEEFLGYTTKEYTIPLITESFHPEEEDRLHAIVMAALDFGFNNPVSIQNCKLFLTYQIRCKSGDYKWILRQSAPLETTSKGFMVSNINLITDISFMKPDKISWLMMGKDIDEDVFNQNVYSAYRNLFTKREKEVLGHLTNGLTSKSIAENLFISKNTVDTHRRNMLKKSGAKNAIELLDFSKKYDITGL